MGLPLRHKPNTNTNAVVTIAADSLLTHVLDAIYCSYGTSPTGGNLKVECPSGTTIFEMDITAAGPQAFAFPNGLDGTKGNAMVITLAAGGVGVQGILNVIKR